MPNTQVTDFSKRQGSPFHNKENSDSLKSSEIFEVTSQFDKHKQIQTELLDKVNKKSAEIASNKPKSDGVFTEVVTHGAFTAPKFVETLRKSPSKSQPTTPAATLPKSLLGFPSSANTLALEAKADLESDSGISQEVKEKVISKLFNLSTMVQHVYESKVRVASDFDKFKEKHYKDEARREKDQSEQLYKLNMSFQNEVVQMIQQLKMDIEATRGNNKIDSEDISRDHNQLYEAEPSIDAQEIEKFDESQKKEDPQRNGLPGSCMNHTSEEEVQ